MIENQNKQIINILPKTWVLVQIKNLGEIISGGTPSTKNNEYWGDDIAWISPADLSGYLHKTISKGRKSLTRLGYKNSSAKLMPVGSILFSSRAPIGYVVIAANEISTNQGFKSIIPSRLVYNEYVYYYLKSATNLAKKNASGTTFLELSAAQFGKIPIPLAPLAEQHRIVAKIEELFSELDKGIESLKKAQEQLKIYRQVLLKHAFEGKLTEKWRSQQLSEGKLESAESLLEKIKLERERLYLEQLNEWEQSVKTWEAGGKQGKKPAKPRSLEKFTEFLEEEKREFFDLPISWMWTKLGNLTFKVEYGTSAKSKKDGLVPVLRMGNIQKGVFEWSDLVYTDDKDEIQKFLLKKGDVLFNRTNSPELVGKTAVYLGERPAIFAGYLIRINQITTLIYSKLLAYYLNSIFAKNYGNKVKSDGVNQSNINGEKLSNYPIPYFSLSEQNLILEEIESRFSICDQLEVTITENLQRAESLRQSILKQAFEGKLVPQDPNDEPAQKLLDRLKKEKNQVNESLQQQLNLE